MALVQAAGLLALLFLAADAAASGSPASGDLIGLRRKCGMLLTEVSAAPYSAEELSMLCRARMPSEICRDSLKLLGPKPWGSGKISAACDTWERDLKMRTLEMAPERRAMSVEDLRNTVDQIMEWKSAVGICRGKSIDKCAAQKKEDYPKYTKKLTDTLAVKSTQLRKSYDVWQSRNPGMGGADLANATKGAKAALKKFTGKPLAKVESKAELQGPPVVPQASAWRSIAAAGAGLIGASVALTAVLGAASRARAVRSVGLASQAHGEDFQESGVLHTSTQE